MNVIWFLSQERNISIVGFNRIVKGNGKTELWVKEQDGTSRKLAEGQQAIDLEKALLDLVWNNTHAIITDGLGNFSSNTDLSDEEEYYEDEEVE